MCSLIASAAACERRPSQQGDSHQVNHDFISHTYDGVPRDIGVGHLVNGAIFENAKRQFDSRHVLR